MLVKPGWRPEEVLFCLILPITLVDSFSLNAVILSPRCGQRFSTSWGNYTYPENFPHDPYPFGLKCRWTVKLPSRDGQVQVTFPYLVLRSMDYVVVSDGPLGQRPCDSAAYGFTSQPEAPVAQRHDHLSIFRGSQTGMTKTEFTFIAASNTAVIDFCPSMFTVGTLDGLGMIIMWEDISSAAQSDLSFAMLPGFHFPQPLEP